MNLESADFLSLPDEPGEAFVALHHRLLAEVIKAAVALKNDARFDYIETMLAFDEVNQLGLLQWGTNVNSKNLEENFPLYLTDVKKAVLRLEMRKALRIRQSAVPTMRLDTTSKEALHQLVNTLREKVRNLDVNTIKRDSLLHKLNAFAGELDQTYTRTEAIFAFAVEAGRVGKQIGEGFEPFSKTLNRILDIVDRLTSGPKLVGRSEQPKQIGTEYEGESSSENDESS